LRLIAGDLNEEGLIVSRGGGKKREQTGGGFSRGEVGRENIPDGVENILRGCREGGRDLRRRQWFQFHGRLGNFMERGFLDSFSGAKFRGFLPLARAADQGQKDHEAGSDHG
jgi:hypothetical protein